MFHVRKSAERGHLDHGWLDTYHTFSFSEYHDPQYMGFRSLRVMNEDRVAPGQGFGMHAHRDMEIVTVVLEGALEHKDSLGHGAVLVPGEVQRISAGTGILHSEFNPSTSEAVHLYQIWLLPAAKGIEPGYEQKALPSKGRQGRWQLVASPDGRDGSLSINQDAELSQAVLGEDQSLAYPLRPGRHAWLQILRGAATVGGQSLGAGDGVAISEEKEVALRATLPSEVLLFDLA
jgi:redox-sensitive bicupin YhaK (pirin superfamily)